MIITIIEMIVIMIKIARSKRRKFYIDHNLFVVKRAVSNMYADMEKGQYMKHAQHSSATCFRDRLAIDFDRAGIASVLLVALKQ